MYVYGVMVCAPPRTTQSRSPLEKATNWLSLAFDLPSGACHISDHTFMECVTSVSLGHILSPAALKSVVQHSPPSGRGSLLVMEIKSGSWTRPE